MELDLGVHSFIVVRLSDLHVLALTITREAAQKLVDEIKRAQGANFCGVAIYEARAVFLPYPNTAQTGDSDDGAA